MKCSDLQIGDYVRLKRTNEIVGVFEIDGDRNVINNEPDGYCSEKNIAVDDVEPITLTLEILERIGFYWGYTSSEEDSINNMPTDIPMSMPDKHWCYDNENGGEITIELPNESEGETLSLSLWCDKLGINRKTASAYKRQHNTSYEETIKHYINKLNV